VSRLWDAVLLEGRAALCGCIVALLGSSARAILRETAVNAAGGDSSMLHIHFHPFGSLVRIQN
jgi:hypothetical protein